MIVEDLRGLVDVDRLDLARPEVSQTPNQPSNSPASTHDLSEAPAQGRSPAWPWPRTYPSCVCPSTTA
eukprot:8742856-Alexandrium_andersonii.AAC.1